MASGVIFENLIPESDIPTMALVGLRPTLPHRMIHVPTTQPGSHRLHRVVPQAAVHIAESWILAGSAAVSLGVPAFASRFRSSKQVSRVFRHDLEPRLEPKLSEP